MPPLDLYDVGFVGVAGASGGGASRSTASDNALLCGGTPYPAAVATSQYWNGSTWDNTVTAMPSARAFGGGGGNYDDYIYAAGDTVGSSGENASEDTFEWNGSAWASATPYPQTGNEYITASFGGNTSEAFIHSGRDAYSSAPFYKTYSNKWNGTAWGSDAGLSSTYGGQANAGGGLPDDFIATAGYGFNGTGTAHNTYKTESFNGIAWTGEDDFPNDAADSATAYAYGCFSAGGKESFLAFANSDSLTNCAFTYDGDSWTSAGTLADPVKYSASNGDTTSAIIAGGADNGWDVASSQLYNGDQTFTSKADLGSGLTAGAMGANTV